MALSTPASTSSPGSQSTDLPRTHMKIVNRSRAGRGVVLRYRSCYVFGIHRRYLRLLSENDVVISSPHSDTCSLS
jgi:hypothetical protein